MSRPPSSFPSSAPTPAPSSPPPPSESFLSELDGTAPSLLETSADYSWEPSKVDSGALNLVSWKLDVNARAGDGVEKRGFNGRVTQLCAKLIVSYFNSAQPSDQESESAEILSETTPTACASSSHASTTRSSVAL